MPSCLAEMGFITDDGDNALFDKNLQSYAAAIADAVETTLGEIKNNTFFNLKEKSCINNNSGNNYIYMVK